MNNEETLKYNELVKELKNVTREIENITYFEKEQKIRQDERQKVAEEIYSNINKRIWVIKHHRSSHDETNKNVLLKGEVDTILKEEIKQKFLNHSLQDKTSASNNQADGLLLESSRGDRHKTADINNHGGKK